MKVRLNILTQLLLGFGLVATVLGLVAGFLLTQLAKVESSYGDVATRIQPANTDTSDAQVLVHRQISAVRGYMISRSPDLVKEYDEATKLLDAEVESLQSHIIDSEQRQQADLLKQRNQESDPPVAQVFELLQTGKAEEANRIFTQEALPIFADMLKLADGLSVRYERRAAEAVASAQAEAALARTWGMVALGAGVAMALLFGILMARGMSAPIRRAAAMAAELAGGNLRVEKLNNRSQNEVGDLARAFDQMVEALQEVVGGVHASTRAVTESAGMLSDVSAQSSQASTQTANAVQQVAGGATRQAESTTEVMSTINQLREAIAQVAEGSQQSSHEVQRAVETLGRMVAEVERMDTSATENAAAALQAPTAAARGAGAVSETVQGMDRIRSAVAQSAERVRSLAKLSEQVGTITDAISGIAEQTNLLALNAAIEAARAGEHGRGFAVVADEVRKLAERAGLSAREITGLVSSIQNGTAEVVSAMETGRSEVESGSRLAANAGETLKQIEVATQRTADEIQRIATAAKATVTSAREVARVFDTIAAVTEENTASAEEMAASSAEVMHSVEEIASVAQENAAAAEEVSASTEEVTASAQEVAEAAAKLQQIAQDLQEQVGRFRL